MKMLVIGHLEAVLGFSLVGVAGQKASTAEEVNQALDSALTAENIGIILVTEDVANLIRPRMEQLKLHSTVPLVVEIPAPDSKREDQQSLNEIVFKAIGVKI